MSWLLRLLALGGLWKKLSGTYQQTTTSIRQAKGFASGVMEKHVHSTLEQAELGDREAIFEMAERFYEELESHGGTYSKFEKSEYQIEEEAREAELESSSAERAVDDFDEGDSRVAVKKIEG